MRVSIFAPRSNKKIGEKESIAHCKPTILQIVRELVLDLVVHLHFSDFGDMVIWRRCCWPPFLQPIWSIIIRRFGDHFGDTKNLEKWASISDNTVQTNHATKTKISKWILIQVESGIGFGSPGLFLDFFSFLGALVQLIGSQCLIRIGNRKKNGSITHCLVYDLVHRKSPTPSEKE